ncbi:hypothetical protein BZG36_02517 [Bifiguratus adelaidae]|uniref:Serine/threonine-protein kinase n=1 Tax=Bifiguratus adelaidae TaxID=1938954 RepID=A0A261Y2R0_9FUNG|nr:hypothetical protein BZG36_02517 [Bifiguratus adelaidae]
MESNWERARVINECVKKNSPLAQRGDKRAIQTESDPAGPLRLKRSHRTLGSSDTDVDDEPDAYYDKTRGQVYRRTRFLGEGGFARVYEVTDSNNRRFAAKVVQKGTLKREKNRKKLLSEIKIHQSMIHKRVVKYHAAFEDTRSVYLILEVCENKTLMDLIKKRECLTEPEVRFYMLQILEACQYMHQHRVIHRDLKLGNLFLDQDMNIKVGDFGLAAVIVKDGERKKTICGTPNYMAPEILFDSQNGHSYEVDIWSLGIILYTMLVGRPPFATEDTKEICRKIKENDYEFPSSPPVSSAARDLVRQLLNTLPDARPTISEIRAHPFFADGYVPEKIPQLAFYEEPKFVKPAEPTTPQLNKIRTGNLADVLGHRFQLGGPSDRYRTGTKRSERDKENQYGNIRDPTAIRNAPSNPSNTNIRPALANGITTKRSALSPKDPAGSGAATGFPAAKEPKADHLDVTEKDKANTGALKAGLHRKQYGEAKHTKRFPYSSSEDGHAKANMSAMTEFYTDLYEVLDKALSFTNPRQLRDYCQKLPPSQPCPTFLSKWIDYSAKYGLSYTLTDGTTGVLFNDETTVTLSPEGHTMHYFEHASNHLTSFPQAACPEKFSKKARILRRFHDYMTDNLNMADYVPHATHSPKALHLKHFFRSKAAMTFYLSHHVLQLNFFDHDKLILYNGGRDMAYVDKQGQFNVLTLESILDPRRADLHQRVKYAKNLVAHVLK